MNILVFLDKKREEYPALQFLARLAGRMEINVTLLYVLMPAEGQEEGQAILAHAAEQAAGCAVASLLRWGDPAGVLLSEAHRGKYNLLILQSGRRRRGFPRLEPIDQILTHSIYPAVLVLRGEVEVRHILICTAGLEGRLEVIEAGALIASALDVPVTLLHVAAGAVPTMYTGLPGFEESITDLLKTDSVIARHLRAGAELLARHEVEGELELRRGAPVDEILREVELGQYDLVVIGRSRIFNGLKEMLMGDVMQRLISQVPVSILVVGEEGLR